MNMLKLALPVMAATLVFASCTSGQKAPKALVLYYSQTSTTDALAQEIQKLLGADIEKIVPVKPYDGTFEETVERGLNEMRSGNMPGLEPLKSDLGSYDIIFLGYPIWFGNYALPIATLLEQETFAGKKIVPFCTFGSGGLVTSSGNIAKKLPEAEVLPGYGVRSARIESMPEEVEQFLKANGYLEGEFVQLPEFGEEHPVSQEEASIFDEAVKDYERIHAQATMVASRPIPGGQEYLFTAKDVPLDAANAPAPAEMKVYVIAKEGKAPEFTQVVR